MIGFLFGFLGHLIVSAIVAGRMYRREYDLVYGSPAPQIYGGKHGHEDAHRAAMREAMPWFAFWPFFGLWAGLGWCITLGHRQRWVEQANELSQLQWETDQLATSQDPLLREYEEAYNELKYGPKNEAPVTETIGEYRVTRKPCPCGYVTECHIHCGPHPASCHYAMTHAKDEIEMRAVRQVFHTGGIIRTKNPEKVADHLTCGMIRTYEVGTVAEPGRRLFIDDRGHCWEG